MTTNTLQGVLVLEPQYQGYIWGGNRLRLGQKTAEAWAVHEDNRIVSGPLAGQTLKEAAAVFGPELLGERAVAQTGSRFPLLIKLLDCAQWLSLQVHPNDAQAIQQKGPGHFGKTEAWHILDAAQGAEILCGFQPGAAQKDWQQAVRDGTIVDLAQRMPVHTGETIFIRAGTMHALGPGLLVYEVQQTSDITYRVYDWGRPNTPERPLHIEPSIAVIDPAAGGQADPQPSFVDGAAHRLVACPYFTLSLLTLEKSAISLNPGGKSFHALTVIDGQVELHGDGWQQNVNRFETVLIPASTSRYQVHPLAQSRVLKASVVD